MSAEPEGAESERLDSEWALYLVRAVARAERWGEERLVVTLVRMAEAVARRRLERRRRAIKAEA